jgi:hypothetical protein
MDKLNVNDKPVNRQKFKLVTKPNASYEEYGWTEEFYNYMLYIEDFEPDHEWMNDPEILNNLGIIYNDGIGVGRNMQKAIMYYQKAIALDYDLARSNMADIYRKGVGGVPKNLEKAFKLYQDCHIPYAYYRVGEAYEFGWGVEQNIAEAKINYIVAYREGHHLALKKLKTFDFLK